MKKKHKTCQISIGRNFALKDLKDVGKRNGRVYSLFVFLGLATLLVILCYSSYFPIKTVVWIKDKPKLISSSIRSSTHPSGTKTQLKTGTLFWDNFFSSEDKEESLEELYNLSDNNKKDKPSQIGACNFPRLKPFDPSIKEFIKTPSKVDCLSKHPLIFRTDFHNKLIQLTQIINTTCCYKTITRGNGSDHNIKYSKSCYKISNQITEIPSDHEYIYVKCVENSDTAGNRNVTSGPLHKDIFAFVPLKPLEMHRSKLKTRVLNKGLNKDKDKDQDLSLIILGLDAQSHMNFIRQMPLTHSFLVRNLSALGLQGYTKVGDNTFPNLVPLLTGLSVPQLKTICWPSKSSYFDNCPFIWKDFTQAGYRTLFAEDSIWMGTFNYEKKGFLRPPTDYYLHPLSLLMAKKIGHETWGNAKLCYGPRLAFEVLLDYLVKAAVAFQGPIGPLNDSKGPFERPSKPYFAFIWANSLFHDYLNNPSLGDELLYLTLKYLSTQGYLSHTALILLSDHGMRWGSIRSTYQGKIEERMPLAYFSFPQWFKNKYPQAIKNLEENSKNRLTTPFDIYETLKDILKGPFKAPENIPLSPPKGISLFTPIPLKRSCKMAGIEEHWCVCNSMKEIPKNSLLAQNAATFIVHKINQILKKFQSFCSKLILFKVSEAMRKIDGDVDFGSDLDFDSNFNQSINQSINKTDKFNNDDKLNKDKPTTIQLQITLVTKPNDAVFEATVHGDGKALKDWTLSGEISRLNLYREQSLCINDPLAQKYCYCFNQVEFNQD